jgi:hypothetical protein
MSSIPTIAEISQFVDGTLRGEVDPNGTGAYNSRAGSDNAALISVLTKVAAKIFAYVAGRAKASLTSTSEATDLDDRLRDVYFDQRHLAASAVGTLYMQRSAGPMAATFIDKGWRAATEQTATAAPVEFESTELVSVAAGQSAVAVPMRCMQLGSVGNVLLVNLNQKLDALDDPNWQIYIPPPGSPILGTAPLDTIGGGLDDETDDEAKARVSGRSALAEPGTKSGIIKGTLDIPGMVSAVPIEVGDGTGVVFAGDINYNLPSAAQSAILSNLESWRPFGVPMAVRPMAPIVVPISLRVYMQQDINRYNVGLLKQNVVAAVERYFQYERLRPEEYFVGAIQTAAAKANAETQSVVVLAPTIDVLRAADQTYGTLLQLVRYVVTDASIAVQFFGPLVSG